MANDKDISWPDAVRDPSNALAVSIVASARRAVREALLDHKLAGNTVATWEHGKVTLVPPEKIAA